MPLSLVHDMVTNRYTALSMSVTALTRILRDVFPNAPVKRLGKKRVSCIVGIKLHTLDSTPTASASLQSAALPSASTQQQPDITAVMMELTRERQRPIALEGEVEELRRSSVSQKYSSAEYQESLCAEVDSILRL